MLRGRTGAVTALCTIATAAVVTAGCGGSSTSSALQLDPVVAAATKTQNAGAAHVHLSMVLTGRRGTVRLHGSGAIDGTSSELNLLSRTPLPSAEAPGAASIKEVALERNGDYVVYLRFGFLSSQLPDGKQWIKVDLTKLGTSAGLDLSKLMSGSGLQPTDLLSLVESDGAKVHKLGSATIGGVATTHYGVTINPAKALQASGLTSPLLSAATSQLKTVHANVWIGKDGLLRRVALHYSSPQARGRRVALRLDISDYGSHVTIAAPSSGQVFNATQLAQQGLAGALH